MYKPKTSLVNGEIIKDLLNLCNDWFMNSMEQSFAGINGVCKYCGAMEGEVNVAHYPPCPVRKYKNICEKHSEYLNIKD